MRVQVQSESNLLPDVRETAMQTCAPVHLALASREPSEFRPQRPDPEQRRPRRAAPDRRRATFATPRSGRQEVLQPADLLANPRRPKRNRTRASDHELTWPRRNCPGAAGIDGDAGEEGSARSERAGERRLPRRASAPASLYGPGGAPPSPVRRRSRRGEERYERLRFLGCSE
jgi:hypothetical protein